MKVHISYWYVLWFHLDFMFLLFSNYYRVCMFLLDINLCNCYLPRNLYTWEWFPLELIFLSPPILFLVIPWWLRKWFSLWVLVLLITNDCTLIGNDPWSYIFLDDFIDLFNFHGFRHKLWPIFLILLSLWTYLLFIGILLVLDVLVWHGMHHVLFMKDYGWCSMLIPY